MKKILLLLMMISFSALAVESIQNEVTDWVEVYRHVPGTPKYCLQKKIGLTLKEWDVCQSKEKAYLKKRQMDEERAEAMRSYSLKVKFNFERFGNSPGFCLKDYKGALTKAQAKECDDFKEKMLKFGYENVGVSDQLAGCDLAPNGTQIVCPDGRVFKLSASENQILRDTRIKEYNSDYERLVYPTGKKVQKH